MIESFTNRINNAFYLYDIFLTCLLIGNVSHAQDLLLQLSTEIGGDKLTKVSYTNGETDSIRADGLIHLAIGTTFATAPESSPSLETQFTVGWKFDNSGAKNGEISWTRYPVELLQFYTNEKWRLGAGLTYHLRPTLKSKGVVDGINVNFDDALGLVFEVDYINSGKNYIGARVVLIDYQIEDTSVDGNSIGIVLGFRP